MIWGLNLTYYLGAESRASPHTRNMASANEIKPQSFPRDISLSSGRRTMQDICMLHWITTPLTLIHHLCNVKKN